MILTCPQCDTRFVVPSTIFMRGGRKLRCSSCKHSWFQEEPLERADGQNFADTLQKSNDKSSMDNSSQGGFFKKIKNDFTQGYKVIGAVFTIVLIGFFVYRMTMPSLIMGQGLAFDNVTIEREKDKLIVAGDIVNAMDGDRGVPMIEVTKILANNIHGDSMIFTPAKDILHSGESMAFTSVLENVGAEVVDLHISFKSDTPPIQVETEHHVEHDEHVNEHH